jgi:7-carboxy-7-deazaguanine synthase
MAAAEPSAALARLKITEIFFSIQGEACFSGWPTVFVRLTGCPLRCTYCDTPYAFHGGEWRSFDEIHDEVASYGARYVCVTGGEPLAQPACAALLTSLFVAGYDVSLERSGAYDIGVADMRVSRVVDLKTPGSGEEPRNRFENLALLTPRDAVKIVVRDRADYDWAKATFADKLASVPCPVFFSPSHAELAPGALADWLLADRLPVRLQVQLHKVLWGDVPGR